MSIADSLPEEFDASAYRSRYADLRGMNESALAAHYARQGRAEGRNASTVPDRSVFVPLIPSDARLLEIGPFGNPLVRGPHVKYFDVLSTAELRQRAPQHGLNPDKCPEVDFVSANGDFAAVSGTFDCVVSSHVIEHQPDVVRHLNDVAAVLEPGGLYFLAVPDKRYCFDHFIAESNLAELIAAHVAGSRVHDLTSVIEHLALTTHNDPGRHWSGDHGAPVHAEQPERLRDAVRAYVSSGGSYIDVHAWQFTPQSFRTIAETLYTLALSPLRVLRLYATTKGWNEFYVVLQKTALTIRPLTSLSALPHDFDPQQYLLLNPDVAAAGVDAAYHYQLYGLREGRKWRA